MNNHVIDLRTVDSALSYNKDGSLDFDLTPRDRDIAQYGQAHRKLEVKAINAAEKAKQDRESI
jgi:hypothetical protein